MRYNLFENNTAGGIDDSTENTFYVFACPWLP